MDALMQPLSADQTDKKSCICFIDYIEGGYYLRV